MTRLSEALKRAAETANTPAITTEDVTPSGAATATTWQFAPVETMHVPVEPAVTSADPGADLLRGNAEGALALDAALEAEAPAFVVEEPLRTTPPVAPATAVAPAKPVSFGAADRDKLVVGDGVDGALIEQYRHLAAVMHHAQKASNIHSIMVTSALPAEGKTLTATNLALTLSESYQRRVLLIDADLRRPRMQEMFALGGSGDGLTDSLAQTRDGRLPVHQVTAHLWVLTAGHVLPDPMSLLVSPAMRQLLDDAKESFDWVVVDTPPIAILPDANLLAAMIDTTLLVVSAQSTPYPMVQRAAQAVGTNRILGVVLNRAEKTNLPANYGYYGSNHYQTGHPTPKKRWFGWLRKSA
jgi:receptor protein-tyrosine kinase